MELNQKRPFTFAAAFFCCFIIFSCGDEQDRTPEEVDLLPEIDTLTVPEKDSLVANDSLVNEPDNPCLPASIADFKSFLNMEYGTKEHEVLQQKVLGDFSGGVYAADSAAFVYKYQSISSAPLELWVNTGSGKVETVFMELLSKGDAYEKDLQMAARKYNIQPCDQLWFGMTAESIKENLGVPDEEAVSKEGVTLLGYDDPSGEVSVSFKCYPDQNNACTSIAVHWFYSTELID